MHSKCKENTIAKHRGQPRTSERGFVTCVFTQPQLVMQPLCKQNLRETKHDVFAKVLMKGLSTG